MLKTYYLLTKPGIILGNVITVVSGYALATQGHFGWLLLAVVAGISCVMASACVFNNYTDRVSDEKMARTKNRALVLGVIKSKSALLFALFLGAAGFIILALYTNLLTVLIASVGFFVYVILYGFWKYLSSLGTIVGSIAGGVPPVIGYCAVSNRFDLGALLLFLIMVLWQMPHFFAIAIYRLEDYTAASIPVLPVQKGLHKTKIQMLLYILAFIGAALTLTFFGYMGYLYMTIAATLGLAWLILCLKGFRVKNNTLWARNMFRVSLVVITAISAVISFS